MTAERGGFVSILSVYFTFEHFRCGLSLFDVLLSEVEDLISHTLRFDTPRELLPLF